MALAGEVTDLSTIRTETVQLGEIDVYVASPAAEGAYPGIVVLEEAFGRVAHIEDLCRRFANAGYVAASPELYARTGAPGEGTRTGPAAAPAGNLRNPAPFEHGRPRAPSGRRPDLAKAALAQRRLRRHVHL